MAKRLAANFETNQEDCEFKNEKEDAECNGETNVKLKVAVDLLQELEEEDSVASAKRPDLRGDNAKNHSAYHFDDFDDDDDEAIPPLKLRKWKSSTTDIHSHVRKTNQLTTTLQKTEFQEAELNGIEGIPSEDIENTVGKMMPQSKPDSISADVQQTETEIRDSTAVELGDHTHSAAQKNVCNSNACSYEQNGEQEGSREERDDSGSVVYIHSDELINHCNRLSRIPDRAGMVHSLIESLGLLSFLRVVAPEAADEQEVRKFHSSDYIEFLQSISHHADEEKIDSSEAEQYGITYDCPVQEGVYECAALVAGGTVTAAKALCDGQCQIAINWCGGWHHAQRSEASGFCYINDIVLGILALRDKFSRVLYVDLDLHHGDGVENAFSTTPHVLTVSFHKYDAGFFPGSGGISDVGSRGGKYYSVNVPLKDGLGDKEFFSVFRRVMTSVRESYAPEVVVCQCGADGLAGDPMSSFNLTITSFRLCLLFLRLWKLPLLLLGGGGYHHANTARCWASLTALAVGRKLPQDVPDHKYFTEYGPDYELNVEAGNRKDHNSVKDLAAVCSTITENLQKIKGHQV